MSDVTTVMLDSHGRDLAVYNVYRPGKGFVVFFYKTLILNWGEVSHVHFKSV